MSLTLRSLPTLLTDCVIVGHARKADVVFTPRLDELAIRLLISSQMEVE